VRLVPVLPGEGGGEQQPQGEAGRAAASPGPTAVRAGLDPEEYGGTYLLGVRGLVVICHGNSSCRAIANALRFGGEALRRGVLSSVEQEVTRLTGA